MPCSDWGAAIVSRDTPMTRRTLVARAVASSALLGGALAFLWVFGPRPTPVHADVYSSLVTAAGVMPPAGEGGMSRHGHVLVNGAAFDYVTGHSRHPLEALLSHYEEQFRAATPDGRALPGATRLETDGMGVVAGMRLSRVVGPGEVRERVQKFAASGRVKDLAEFHVVVAYAKSRGSVFIDFTPGPDVTLRSLVPSGGADAPGADLPGVTRPQGVQRLFTIEHGNEGDWSRTLIYRSIDGRAGLDAFRSSLLAAGWTPSPATPSGTVSHLTDGTRECFLGGADLEGSAAVVLVYRRLAQPRNQP